MFCARMIKYTLDLELWAMKIRTKKSQWENIKFELFVETLPKALPSPFSNKPKKMLKVDITVEQHIVLHPYYLGQ